MKTLPDKLILLMAKYYFQRGQQEKWYRMKALYKGYSYTYESLGDCTIRITIDGKLPDEPPKFDKDGIRKEIDEIAFKHGWSYSGIAGTFFFTRLNKKNGTLIHQRQCGECNYLTGGVESIYFTKAEKERRDKKNAEKEAKKQANFYKKYEQEEVYQD